MEITSHFLGVNLDNKLFIDLFVELQSYLLQNSITSSLEFSNPLSMHITLYYFPGQLSSEEYAGITKKIKALNIKHVYCSVNINEYGIFKRDGQDRLCYLRPSTNSIFQKINNDFKNKFPNSIIDNTQEFSSHISLFKILDKQQFTNHKKQILSIIKKHLLAIQGENAYKAILLYCVNSKFRPQIQLIKD